MEALLHHILIKWAEIIKQRIEAKINAQQGIPGEAHIEIKNAYEIMVIAGAILVNLSTSDFKAFIAEYGSGSLLDESNPYLQAYKSSLMWNPQRESEGNGFLGRQTGDTVHVPDGKTYESTGKMRGMHLEWRIKANQHRHKELPPFKPFKPQHIIEREIKDAIPEINAEIASSVKSYLLKDIFVANAKIVL